MMDLREISLWLREEEPGRLRRLFAQADQVRQVHVGDEVHLRGLVEISNHCVRSCSYCGLRRGNKQIIRYRLSSEVVLRCAEAARRLGCGTVVVQAGVDPGLSCEWLAELIVEIRRRVGLAVTLSLGERPLVELARLRDAGADRYLLRFETSNAPVLTDVHPPLFENEPTRCEMLQQLQRLGFEVGSGVMVGLPGTTYDDLARDIVRFRELDLDMIGVGPYIPHPDTPLGRKASGGEHGQQVPATAAMTYKVMALARLVCPLSNIPATTALTTLAPQQGLSLGLLCGANVWMPSLTPPTARRQYHVYPGKTKISPVDGLSAPEMRRWLESIGRGLGSGRGDSPNRQHRVTASFDSHPSEIRETESSCYAPAIV